jgi:hypothetical protein
MDFTAAIIKVMECNNSPSLPLSTITFNSIWGYRGLRRGLRGVLRGGFGRARALLQSGNFLDTSVHLVLPCSVCMATHVPVGGSP